MKYRLFALAALATALLLLGGCQAGLGDAKQAATVVDPSGPSAKISVSVVNPIMSRYLSAASASGSKAFMFATYGYVGVYKITDGSWNYVNTSYFSATPEGPQNGNEMVSIPLEAGGYYYIYAYTKNDYESDANYYYQSYGSTYFTMNAQGDTYVSITLTPYGSYPVTQSTPQSLNIKSSIYNVSTEVFTTIGGEKWFYYSTADSEEVVAFTISPPSGVYVYAALFDGSGSFLTAGVSPSFMGGSGDAVTLEAGSTPYTTVYLGVITIADTSADQSVIVAYAAPTIADDVYEPNDSAGSASSSLSFNSTYELKAYDWDYFSFYMSPSNSYTFMVNSGGTDPVQLQWRLYSYDSGTYTYTMVDSGHESGYAYYSLAPTVPAAGTYYLGINVQAESALGFPIAGGAYSLYSYYSTP